MRRRQFISLCALATTACGGGRNSTSPAATGQPAAAPANPSGIALIAAATDDRQRIIIRAIGLNAVIRESSQLHLAMLNPEGILIPSTEHRFPAHYIDLVIARKALADESLGSAPTADQLKRWNLRDKGTEFRVWRISGDKVATLSIANVTGPTAEAALYGLVPMTSLYPKPEGSFIDWKRKPQAFGQFPLPFGKVTDDLPRIYKSGAERRLWRLTHKTWNEEKGQTPRRLTDTVKIEMEAAAAPVKFIVDNGGEKLELLTKGSSVEAYIVTLPTALHKEEVERPHQLFHTIGGYALFDRAPDLTPIPVGDPSFQALDEPVFCPPLYYEN